MEIKRVQNKDKSRVWEKFRKYHYLNTSLHQAAEQWVGIIDGEIVAHTGVIQFPMRKGWKRIHRFVVLPDYQGIGIGVKFINEVCNSYAKEGWDVNLTTTTPALVHALCKNKEWILFRKGRMGNDVKGWAKTYGDNAPSGSRELVKSNSGNRVTFSFVYKCLKGEGE